MTTVILTVLLAIGPLAASQVPGPPKQGPASPQRDPVTVRGCLLGRSFRIVEHDIVELSGVREVRLKGRRGVLKQLRDSSSGAGYVEIVGQLDVPAVDRIETRATRKIGTRTTVSVGAAAEQGTPIAAPPATLVVEAFTVIAPTCPVAK